MSAKSLRVTECTQLAFNRLPATVSRAEFLDWTGLNKNELAAEVNAGRIAIYKPKPNGKARYYKHEIARLSNFKM